MAGKGGKRSTSFTPTWKLGKTRQIRVPEVIADRVLAYAKAIDEGRDPDRARMLVIVNEFIDTESRSHGTNQHKKEFSIETRDWFKFKKFKKIIESRL